jgi:aspartate/methionine/tyrosine aminotransferase
MDIQTFLLERNQSEYENEVDINLTESGVHPLPVKQLLDADEIDQLLSLSIGYGHTEGTPALRQAIASWYPGAGADNVLVTTGASEANFVVAWSLLDRGDRVALMVPNFMQLDGAARSFGAEVVPLPLRPELGWRFDLDEIARLLESGCKLVSIVNPNNPSGRIMPAEDMRALVQLVERASAWLLVDEIYRGAELGDQPETPTFWGMSDRVIVTSSTSKSIAHAGLRLGWIVAPDPMIRQFMRRQDYTTIGTSPLSQFLALKLLSPPMRERILARSRRILTDNLALFERWAAGRQGISYTPPQAGGMVFFRYAHPLNSTELSRRLREQESVFIVAGDWFGFDGHLRVGIGGKPEHIGHGLARLGTFLDGLND